MGVDERLTAERGTGASRAETAVVLAELVERRGPVGPGTALLRLRTRTYTGTGAPGRASHPPWRGFPARYTDGLTPVWFLNAALNANALP